MVFSITTGSFLAGTSTLMNGTCLPAVCKVYKFFISDAWPSVPIPPFAVVLPHKEPGKKQKK